MTLDPAYVVAALIAMGTLLLFVMRGFASGAIMPRSLVPREDYDARGKIIEDHAGINATNAAINAKNGELLVQSLEAIRVLTELVRAERTKNGAG